MGFAIERACADECGLKKVCSMKDEVPIGDVVYEKDGYAIHKIDGEEHKVCMALYHRSFDHRRIGS